MKGRKLEGGRSEELGSQDIAWVQPLYTEVSVLKDCTALRDRSHNPRPAPPYDVGTYAVECSICLAPHSTNTLASLSPVTVAPPRAPWALAQAEREGVLLPWALGLSLQGTDRHFSLWPSAAERAWI